MTPDNSTESENSNLSQLEFQPECESTEHAHEVATVHSAQWLIILKCGCTQFWCSAQFRDYSAVMRRVRFVDCYECMGAYDVVNWRALDATATGGTDPRFKHGR